MSFCRGTQVQGPGLHPRSSHILEFGSSGKSNVTNHQIQVPNDFHPIWGLLDNRLGLQIWKACRCKRSQWLATSVIWVYTKMIQALVERRFARCDITNFWLWGEGFCPRCWKHQEATARHYKETAALRFWNVRHQRTRQTTGFGHVDVVPCVEVSWTGDEVVQVLVISCASVYLIFIGPWLALLINIHISNTYDIWTNVCLWWYLCYFTGSASVKVAALICASLIRYVFCSGRSRRNCLFNALRARNSKSICVILLNICAKCKLFLP